jgi:hypothetical protein
LENFRTEYAELKAGYRASTKKQRPMLSSYYHVNDFVFNVHSYGIIGKIILLYRKEITAAISSSINQQHQWSRLSSIHKALGCK